MIVGVGPEWLIDIDALSKLMNYSPVFAGTNSNDFSGKGASFDAVTIADYPNDPLMPNLEDVGIFDDAYDDRDGARLVTQSHRQEEGIDYDEVFAPVARIEFTDRVYKVEKALYGLHQAPRVWYETLSTYLLDNGFKKGKIDKTLFIKKIKDDILLVQVYVDDTIFCLTKSVKSASTPMETHKPLSKDENGTDVDVHLYRSMIGSLMYLTSFMPDIMCVVCTCPRFQVQPKVSHMHAVKRIFRYLKGQPTLGLWYPKDPPLELLAYFDSDYAGDSLDRKSTTRSCQFLGSRLISWQCNKQTIMANSITEAKYIAASNYRGQVLWLQNQLLDYCYNFILELKGYLINDGYADLVQHADDYFNTAGVFLLGFHQHNKWSSIHHL
nr:hypothetical protein [Tanacetum cinerariifolium]